MFAFVRFEVLTVVLVQTVVLACDPMLGVFNRIGGKGCICLQGGPENGRFPVHDSYCFISGPISSALLTTVLRTGKYDASNSS
jgi:hypothetical protein